MSEPGEIVLRLLLAILLVGIVWLGGNDNSPGDVSAPASPAVDPENATADEPKPNADESPAQAIQSRTATNVPSPKV
ncbi:MAG: hypothetical protein CMJ68_10915 [Planctomycetaceae bacterium]|nr:hypothetical protein [Planctomycetaceae bacterium]